MLKKVLSGLFIFSLYFPLLNALGENTAYGTGEIFLASYDTDAPLTPETYWTTMFTTGDTTLVPLIGQYDGGNYRTNTRIALIRLNPRVAWAAMPESVQDIVGKGVDFECYVNITAKAQSVGNNQLNIAFHPVLGRWIGTRDFFDKTIQMGMFDPHGTLNGGDLAQDELGGVGQNYHGPLPAHLFSGNVGQFFFNTGRGLSAFWIVGVYNGHTNVTFNIMAHDSKTGDLLNPIRDAASVTHLIEILDNVCKKLPIDDRFDDRRVLRRAVETLRTITSTRDRGDHSDSGYASRREQPVRSTAGHARSSVTTRSRLRKDQDDLESLVTEFQSFVLQNKVGSAKLLLSKIERLDQERAQICREFFEAQA